MNVEGLAPLLSIFFVNASVTCQHVMHVMWIPVGHGMTQVDTAALQQLLPLSS